jgi:hypothetical protein
MDYKQKNPIKDKITCSIATGNEHAPKITNNLVVKLLN